MNTRSIQAAFAFAALTTFAGSAMADVFPAGIACQSFAVQTTTTGTPVGFMGDASRGRGLVSAGSGVQWTFTNLATGAQWSPASSGASVKLQPGANGSVTITFTGGNGIIMFPTDTPAGPSTTWYSGRVVFDVDSQSNFTLISSAGAKTDVCAELSN